MAGTASPRRAKVRCKNVLLETDAPATLPPTRFGTAAAELLFDL
ncbi:MAG: hypothetical protein ACI8U4_002572, partial [Natronomonas sp.]